MHVAWFLNSKFRDTVQCGLALIFQAEGLTMLCPVLVCLRKAVTLKLHSGSECMVKCSKKLAVRFGAPSRCPYFMLLNKAACWHLPTLLSPERPCHHSQMHSEKGTISPRATQSIVRPHYLLPCLRPPPQKHPKAYQE